MTEREQVIAELLYLKHDCLEGSATDQTLDKAIALLKAQEPVEPKEVIYDDEHRSVYCPSCDNRLAGLTYSGAVALETEETPNYCWKCGQAVKWE